MRLDSEGFGGDVREEVNTNVDIEKGVIAFLNYYEGGVMYIGDVMVEE